MDPLAPVSPGDPVSTLLSAERHNAYAHAARTVAGDPPVRWARQQRAKRYSPPTLLYLGGGVARYDLLDADATAITTGAIPLGPEEPHWQYVVRFDNTVPYGFPPVEDHPDYELQDPIGYPGAQILVKKTGIYRATLSYLVSATVGEDKTSEHETSAAGTGPHTHTYQRSPLELRDIGVGISINMQNHHWVDLHSGGPSIAGRGGTLVTYLARGPSGSGLDPFIYPVIEYTYSYDWTGTLFVSRLILTIERVGPLVL